MPGVRAPHFYLIPFRTNTGNFDSRSQLVLALLLQLLSAPTTRTGQLNDICVTTSPSHTRASSGFELTVQEFIQLRARLFSRPDFML